MTTTSTKTRRAKSKKAKRPSRTTKPNKLTLRSYQVGFGDCYLLTFHYASANRHVLIDFGSTGQPEDASSDLMLQVANDISKRCDGHLDIVVATHRHKDHISGFATNKDGTASGDVIRACQPDVVIQPWTEDPNARTNARRATTSSRGKSIAFVDTLLDMHAVAAAVKAEVNHLKLGIHPSLRNQLAFLGEDNLTNKPAVENLIAMAKRKGARALYVNYDFDNPLDLDDVLPGVTVRVLGPPNLEQSEAIKKMRSKDAAEFWQLQALAGKPVLLQSAPIFPNIVGGPTSTLTPPYTRWFVGRMNSIRGVHLLELVRILDSVMNNTSTILLFEAGRKKLLFPGDAQIENWSYALDQAEVRKHLADVDVYKVGHHGSRNANPKTLWNLFSKRDAKPSARRLQTLLSTMEGKHGDPKKHTEVPRESLVDALKKESTYFSTQDLKSDELSKAFTIDLT